MNSIDRINSIILIFLYSLQGLVIGLLLGSLEMKLKKYFTYSEIGLFLMCSYPFSLKLLWSPIVDSVYSKKLGLRKTWIIPTTFISGIFLYYLSIEVENFIESRNIIKFSIICLIIMFLIATQDIAVDGLALTLCKENCSQASSCQTIGQKIGIFISTTVFMNLSSKNFKYYLQIFTNNHLEEPLINLNGYIYFISLVFFSSIIVILMIPENDEIVNNEGVIKTYLTLKDMFKNPYLLKFLSLLLISKIGQVFYNNIIGLVLIEKGFSQETLTNLSTLLIPIELFLSYYMSSFKKDFIQKYLFAYKNLIFIYLLELILIYFYDYIKAHVYGDYVLIFSILVIDVIKTILLILGFNSMGGFFYKICDKKIGATYITALYTFNNLSEKWPNIFIYASVDYFGYYLVGIISIIYNLLYYNFSKKYWIMIESYEIKVWETCKSKDT